MAINKPQKTAKANITTKKVPSLSKKRVEKETSIKDLIEINKELNVAIKEFFEFTDKRLSRIESIIFSRNEERKKSPEYCYN